MKGAILDKANKLSINSDRLSNDIEKCTVEWLLKNRRGALWSIPYDSNLDMIKDAILCMDKCHTNYIHLPINKKDVVEDLLYNEDIIDIVLVTLFQWFGTSVGQHEITKLIDNRRD